MTTMDPKRHDVIDVAATLFPKVKTTRVPPYVGPRCGAMECWYTSVFPMKEYFGPLATVARLLPATITCTDDDTVPTYGVSHAMSADETNEPSEEPLLSTPNEHRGTAPSSARTVSCKLFPAIHTTAPPSDGPRAGETEDVVGVAVIFKTTSLSCGRDVGKSRPW